VYFEDVPVICLLVIAMFFAISVESLSIAGCSKQKMGNLGLAHRRVKRKAISCALSTAREHQSSCSSGPTGNTSPKDNATLRGRCMEKWSFSRMCRKKRLMNLLLSDLKLLNFRVGFCASSSGSPHNYAVDGLDQSLTGGPFQSCYARTLFADP
jgi:hypothetical protein